MSNLGYKIMRQSGLQSVAALRLVFDSGETYNLSEATEKLGPSHDAVNMLMNAMLDVTEAETSLSGPKRDPQEILEQYPAIAA